MASSAKKIRLEQKVIPVSSEEELNLIVLREQNLRLHNNYNHRLRIETELKDRIEQLENALKHCEDEAPEHQLVAINKDLRDRCEELEFELNKSRLGESRLEDYLVQLKEDFDTLKRKLATTNSDCNRNSNFTHNNTNANSVTTGLKVAGETSASTQETSKFNDVSVQNDHINSAQAKTIRDLQTKLDNQTELADNRMAELNELLEKYKLALDEIERLKVDARCIPKSTIIETPEYKTLQSHFSVLYNEATQLKTQLLESKSVIIVMRNTHAKHIETLEHDDLRMQEEYRTKIIDLEKNLAEEKSQNDIYRVQLEDSNKQNEHVIKLDSELKKSLSSYKQQVKQQLNAINNHRQTIDDLRRQLDKYKNSSYQNNSNNTSDNINNYNPTNLPNTKTTNPSGTSSSNNSINNHSPQKRISELEKTVSQLQKQLEKTKSEEEALMQEIDVTGQAFEEMQDQNHRLLQQLEEKDDANFKLMSEHLKTNAYQAHLNTEKEVLEKIKEDLQKRENATDRVIEELQEKSQLLHEHIATLEKELELKNSLNDSFKQQKLELNQQLVEIQFEKEKIVNVLDQTQKSHNEKESLTMIESFRVKRLTEEIDSWKRKYERAKKFESANTPDEVLIQEIREYKEQLTCPSCKTKPKDAVLTKCFHVFCFDCLKTRVDTRQRKCPKCNAQFGTKDFHRLYLT